MEDKPFANTGFWVIVDRRIPEIFEKGGFLVLNHIDWHRVVSVVDQVFGRSVGNSRLNTKPNDINDHYFEDILVNKDTFMVIQVQNRQEQKNKQHQNGGQYTELQITKSICIVLQVFAPLKMVNGEILMRRDGIRPAIIIKGLNTIFFSFPEKWIKIKRITAENRDIELLFIDQPSVFFPEVVDMVFEHILFQLFYFFILYIIVIEDGLYLYLVVDIFVIKIPVSFTHIEQSPVVLTHVV